jgi:DNA-directed RNA polymerase specialized sigma24 family protein
VARWSDADFDAYVASRLPSLIAFGYGLTGDIGHSQDLAQSALMTVYLTSRRQMPDDPDATVRRAMAHDYVSSKRRRRPEKLVEVVPDSRVGVEELPGEQPDGTAALLSRLSQRQRAVLVLRYREDWTEPQIADALGMTTGAVAELASSGLAALREQLGSREGTSS